MIVHDHWLLTPARAAIHLPTRTAVIADLHLGYAEARRRSGDAVPPRSVEAVLGPLLALLATHGARCLAIAGDLFEAGAQPALMDDLLRCLAGAGIELVALVPGNHDKGLEKLPALPVRPDGATVGGWRIVHGDGCLPTGPVLHGHEHPCLRRGRVQAPCFLVGPERLVLPACSPDAAGVNVLGERRWTGYRVAVIAADRVLDFGEAGRMQALLARGGDR